MGAYQHFGSASSTVDYKTDLGSLYLAAELFLGKGWALHLDGVYTLSEAAFDAIEVNLPEEVVEHGDYDFTNVHTYSDLKYGQLETTGKVTWGFNPSSKLYVALSYFDLQDDAAYTYGDMSGSVLYTRSGVTVNF